MLLGPPPKVIWTRLGNCATEEEGAAIALGPDGGPHVAGTATECVDPGWIVICKGGDFITLRYDTDGNELWTARYDGAEGSVNESQAIAVGPASDVHVTGSVGGDFVTVKYSEERRCPVAPSSLLTREAAGTRLASSSGAVRKPRIAGGLRVRSGRRLR